MLDQLLESGERRDRAGGVRLVSVVGHSAGVIWAVMATAHVAAPGARPGEWAAERVHYAHYVAPRRLLPMPRSRDDGVVRHGARRTPLCSMSPTSEVQFVPPEFILEPLPELASVEGETSWLDAAPPNRVGADASTGGTSGALDAPYFAFAVEHEARLLPGVAPRYPEMLRRAGVAGEVLAQFVVDTTGRAELATFRVLRSDHELFSAAVGAALPRMRFAPAEARGRRVRQLVQAPFTFELERTP